MSDTTKTKALQLLGWYREGSFPALFTDSVSVVKQWMEQGHKVSGVIRHDGLAVEAAPSATTRDDTQARTGNTAQHQAAQFAGIEQGQASERNNAQLQAKAAAPAEAQEYGSAADMVSRIEQFIAKNGRQDSATLLLYEAMKVLRNSTPVPVSADIRRMAQRIAADKFEHYTADPIFTVQRRHVMGGLDPEYADDVGWFHDDERITGAEAEALESTYQDTGKEPDGYIRTGFAETWEHSATYVTKEAAEAFVRLKGDDYRVYVDSGCRNHEWQALRAFLLQIAAQQGKGG